MSFGDRRRTRAEALRLGVLGGAALALPAGIGVSRSAAAEPVAPLAAPFEVPLVVPPVLKPVRRTATTDYYRVVMREAEAQIVPGQPTPIWGYNGTFPGPTIRARRGRRTVVTQVNNLPEDMVVHLHGAYADGNNDGHPSNPVKPGGSKSYVYGNNQNARFMWYHDHAMDLTSPHVYKGLAGMFLLGDDFEDRLPLPKGPFDVPLMIQDRTFTADNRFNYPGGVFGNLILVNGKPQPRFEVQARRYRLRFLNASNAQSYELALDTGDPMTLIATEGGLLARPVEVTSLPITMAERYEVVVDFASFPVGSQVVLKNRKGFADGTRDVMRFDVVMRQGEDTSRVPPTLRPASAQVDPTHLSDDTSVVRATRRWVFDQTNGHWTINGLHWDANRIDARPREGDAEVWEFVNAQGVEHPAHPHLINFRVMERNGRAPLVHERGWKDTVAVGPFETVRVLMKWPKAPVETGSTSPWVRKYPFHCHQLEHEDHMMMLQYELLPPRRT